MAVAGGSLGPSVQLQHTLRSRQIGTLEFISKYNSKLFHIYSCFEAYVESKCTCQ